MIFVWVVPWPTFFRLLFVDSFSVGGWMVCARRFSFQPRQCHNGTRSLTQRKKSGDELEAQKRHKTKPAVCGMHKSDEQRVVPCGIENVWRQKGRKGSKKVALYAAGGCVLPGSLLRACAAPRPLRSRQSLAAGCCYCSSRALLAPLECCIFIGRTWLP
nr:hypothetical protein [Pandoravirus aubagnensis]